MSFRFIHCSDIHLLSLEGVSPVRFLNKRFTGGVNLLLKRKKGHDGALFDEIVEYGKQLEVDRLVITGDLTNLALESEFELVRRTLDDCGLPVTVIPGNHDIYTRGSARKKRFEAFLSHLMEGERVDDFHYPFVQRYGRSSLIGINSAIPTMPLSAVGKVGPAQLERLGRVLQKEGAAGQQRIVLIHHPPGEGRSDAGHELLDTEALGAVIAEHGAELVLHGHEHVDMDYSLSGPGGEVPVHGIASGTSRSLRPGREAAFTLYDCVDGNFHRRRWRLEGHDFKPVD